MVLAAHRREEFKAIIIVPVHPEGDYVASSGPLGVMNYQYKTISRYVSREITLISMCVEVDPPLWNNFKNKQEDKLIQWITFAFVL